MEDRMFQAEGKWAEALATFKIRKQAGKVEEESLLYWCSNAQNKCEDAVVLQQCVSWMQELAERNPSPDGLDTYARLLWKTGSQPKAKTVMEQAVALGKQRQEDVRSSEAWLKKNFPQ
jgi:hypothetical protein